MLPLSARRRHTTRLARTRGAAAVAALGATLTLGASCRAADEPTPRVVARLEHATPFPPPGVPAGGAPVAVRVRALDAAGAPVRGATIVWVAENGTVYTLNGRVDPTSSTTDAQGMATTTWTGGTRAGLAELRVSAVGGVASAIRFYLSVAPLGIAQLTPTFHTPADPPLVAGTGALMIAYPTDRYGNALGPTRTRWRSSDPRVAVVDSGGPSNFAGVRFLAPGTVTITATMDSVSGARTLTVGAAPAAVRRDAPVDP